MSEDALDLLKDDPMVRWILGLTRNCSDMAKIQYQPGETKRPWFGSVLMQIDQRSIQRQVQKMPDELLGRMQKLSEGSRICSGGSEESFATILARLWRCPWGP